MPLFETGIVQVNSSVGSLSSLIWNPAYTGTTTFGPLGGIAVGSSLKDVTIMNTGPGTVYVAAGSMAASATPIGAPVVPGGQMTLEGYSVTAANNTVGQLWGIVATGGSNSSTTAGLATSDPVV